MHDILWNSRVLGAMQAHACLTEEEIIVLEDWINGKSIDNTAMMRHMSDRKVDRLRHSIRDKYDRVQPYTDLPIRNRRK
jgi:DNA-binding CsgD family transcriptional regulator